MKRQCSKCLNVRLTFNYSVIEMGYVDVWVGTDHTVCTKPQKTDKTLIYQHIFFKLITQWGLFVCLVEKAVV